ncbi:MAG: hydrolase [Lachnospiraceae bacterium]|nr:hydrolase [Lachnospiraceae bacterium]
MKTKKEDSEKFKCPCCGYYTLPGAGAYDICPVCFWEDDPVQEDDPDYAGGANDLSLNECRKNFELYGACEERFVSRVRKPLPEEIR